MDPVVRLLTQDEWQHVAAFATALSAVFAVVIYAVTTVRQNRDHNEAVFSALDDRWREWLQLVLAHPELDLADLPMEPPPPPFRRDQLVRREAMLNVFLAMLETAYRLYTEGPGRRRDQEWNGWCEYMRDWRHDRRVADAWAELVPMYHGPFQQFFMALPPPEAGTASGDAFRSGVSIRPIEEGDAAFVVEASLDRSITDATYLPALMDLEEARTWIRARDEAWLVTVGDRPAGVISVRPHVDTGEGEAPITAGAAETDTWLLESFRGRGIATAAHALLREVLQGRYPSVVAVVWEENTASIRRLLRDGYLKRGRTWWTGTGATPGWCLVLERVLPVDGDAAALDGPAVPAPPGPAAPLR